jgi:PEP-CTERM motif
MQKRTLFARARRGLLALLGLGLGGFVAPTLAGVYQASADFSFTNQVSNFGTGFSLPKYSGTGRITGVTLTLTGFAQATIFYTFFVEDGITATPLESTSDLLVFGLPSETNLIDLKTSVNFPGVSVPPCPDCGCPDCAPQAKEVNISSDLVRLLGSVNLTDFSDFAGSGSNDFFVTPFGPVATETFDASGTVTETIFTSVPEPSTWAMMLIGFAGLACLGWRRGAKQHPRALFGVTELPA